MKVKSTNNKLEEMIGKKAAQLAADYDEANTSSGKKLLENLVAELEPVFGGVGTSNAQLQFDEIVNGSGSVIKMTVDLDSDTLGLRDIYIEADYEYGLPALKRVDRVTGIYHSTLADLLYTGRKNFTEWQAENQRRLEAERKGKKERDQAEAAWSRYDKEVRETRGRNERMIIRTLAEFAQPYKVQKVTYAIGHRERTVYADSGGTSSDAMKVLNYERLWNEATLQFEPGSLYTVVRVGDFVDYEPPFTDQPCTYAWSVLDRQGNEYEFVLGPLDDRDLICNTIMSKLDDLPSPPRMARPGKPTDVFETPIDSSEGIAKGESDE